MKPRPHPVRHLVEVSFVSCASAATGASIALAAAHIADVGDLLGFVGAFVGAVLTVGGAIYISDRASRKQGREALLLIHETMMGIDASCAFLQRLKCGEPAENDGPPAEMAGRLRHELLSIPIVGTVLDQQFILSQIKSPDLFRHLIEVREYLSNVKPDFLRASALRTRWNVTLPGKDYVHVEIQDEVMIELRLVAQNAALAAERAMGFNRFENT